MSRISFLRQVETLLAECDICINGDRPWDPHIHDPHLYSRLLAKGSKGIGESYMDSWWDASELAANVHDRG